MDKYLYYKKIASIIYGLTVVLTLAVIFLTGLPFVRENHLWITLSALLLAETIAFRVVIYMLSNHKQFTKLIPGYMAYGTVSGVYFLSVILIVGLFSLWLNVSTFSYFLIHLIALAAAAIVFGLVALYVKNVGHQEADTASQVQLLKGMQLTLLTVKQHVDMWNDENSGSIKQLVEQLEEKVRYSDPISHPSLSLTDQELVQQIQELAERISALVRDTEQQEDVGNLGKFIRNIEHQLEERNRQLVELK